MKKLFLLIAVTCYGTVFGQTESTKSKAMSGKFEYFYNEKIYDSIFSLFSTEMQEALPLNKTNDFFRDLMSQAGRITKRAFIHYKSGFAIYKTNFEKEVLSVNVSVDLNSKINGLLIEPFIDEQQIPSVRNVTKISLPFKEEWTVVWGGDTKELNYHVVNKAQKNAFDILIIDKNERSFKTTGATNEDYYAFGKELVAPCDGEIVLVTDGIKDNKPGEMNPAIATGNSVILKTINNEFLVFAHFKQNSIVVKQGQQVKRGALLGKCGNSGNSSEPHLHFHIQDKKDMNAATGIKCFFDKLLVNGEIRTDYSPVQKDRVKTINN